MSGRGRGWYYKQKYGGRGRGGRQDRGEQESHEERTNGGLSLPGLAAYPKSLDASAASRMT